MPAHRKTYDPGGPGGEDVRHPAGRVCLGDGKNSAGRETLERIAAALDTEVTEVICGVPQTPDLRRIKRRWALIGGETAIILTIFIIILYIYAFVGTWRYGLRYQFWNQNYAVTLEELFGAYSLERSAAMRTTVAGIQLSPSHHSTMASLKSDGNFFGFHVYPAEAYHGDLLPDGWDTTSIVTITVTGLAPVYHPAAPLSQSFFLISMIFL